MKVMMVANLARICGLRENDIVYTTLPLYHSAGLLIGVGGCLEVGMCPTSHGGWTAWGLGQLDRAVGDGQMGKCVGRGVRKEREMERKRKRSYVHKQMSEVDGWMFYGAGLMLYGGWMDGQICGGGQIHGDGWMAALWCCIFVRDGRTDVRWGRMGGCFKGDGSVPGDGLKDDGKTCKSGEKKFDL